MKKYAFIIACLLAVTGAQAQQPAEDKSISPDQNRPTQSRPDTKTDEGLNRPGQPARDSTVNRPYDTTPVQTPAKPTQAETPIPEAPIQSQPIEDKAGQITDESAGAKNDASILGEMSEADRTLTTTIRQGLTTSTTFTGVPATTWRAMTIHSKEGAITLSGNVQSEEQKRQIEAEVKKMQGVQSVKNNLTVQSSSTDPSTRTETEPAPGTSPAGADSTQPQPPVQSPARPSDTDRQPEGSGTGKDSSSGTLK